ncbi:MAG: universal stress protein [Myxococcales bacterium]|nr:universal stress protein [Myxococcales bacterium]
MKLQAANILCPVDFSKCSARALDYAIQLGETLGSELHLLHAYIDPLSRVPFGRPGLQGPASAPSEVIDHATSRRAREVDKLRARCSGYAPAVDIAEVEGDPKVVIPEYAQKISADLIVMGTHGRTRLARVLLGSVAERMVRVAPCPVLTVP